MGTWETGRVLEIDAPAKINLFLEILGKRPDGYHNISSLIIPISLCDKLTFQRIEDEIELVTESEDIPAGDGNLVVKAAKLLRDTFNVNAGARISLTKNIPVGAGLGGGSSDAAAALKALNQLWELDLAPTRLLSLADEIGADVPFFIHAASALVGGRGEDITPVENNLGQLRFVLAVPDFGVSTEEVYSRVQVPQSDQCRLVAGVIDGLAKGDWEHVNRNFFNRLQEAAFLAEPRLEMFYGELSRACDSRIIMSGSGSAFFVCCKTAGECEDIIRSLEVVDRARLTEVSSLENDYSKPRVGVNE